MMCLLRGPLVLLLLACFALAAFGCAKQPPAPQEVVRRSPGVAQGLGSWMELAPAIAGSLRYVRNRPGEQRAVSAPWLPVTWHCLETTLEHLQELLPRLDAEPGLLAREFVWRRIEPDVLLTGYYEPFLEASLTPHPAYPYPLYAKPPGMAPADPALTRAAIDGRGALAGKGLELAWAKDPVDVFFLQVQGSGRLLLPDGTTKRILWAGSNGHEYVSLGRELIERGYATRDEMSMQKIREILAAHPDKRDELLFLNPKYIFFRLSDEGPFGATNAKLTPMVSCAVDREYTPLGSVLAVSAELPEVAEYAWPQELWGVLLAQDTGTMERNHLDLFCGAGPQAAALAGRMSGRAWAWVLLSRRCAK